MSRSPEAKRRRLNVARTVGRAARAARIAPRPTSTGVRAVGTSIYFYCPVSPSTLLELHVALQRAAEDLQEAWAAESSWEIGIWVYINAGGGSYAEGLAAYDIVRMCGVHVTTVVVGRAQGAAALMAMGGTLRVMTSSARIVPAAATDAPACDALAERDVVVDVYARDDKATISAIIDLGRGVFALEAREIGLVDEVW